MLQILERIRAGGGLPGDTDLLLEVCSQIDGRSFCGLGDAAAWPVAAAIRVFPEEFEYYIANGKSMVTSRESLVMMPEEVSVVGFDDVAPRTGNRSELPELAENA